MSQPNDILDTLYNPQTGAWDIDFDAAPPQAAQHCSVVANAPRETVNHGIPANEAEVIIIAGKGSLTAGACGKAAPELSIDVHTQMMAVAADAAVTTGRKKVIVTLNGGVESVSGDVPMLDAAAYGIFILKDPASDMRGGSYWLSQMERTAGGPRREISPADIDQINRVKAVGFIF
ncbi:MAG: hypothetical protein AB7G06_05635 [Bdellovibrionales bacterium]